MILLGLYSAYLTETFFVEQGKAYDTEDPISGPVVRDIADRFPDAFSGTPKPTPAPPPVEKATAAPGEVRHTPQKRTPGRD